MQLPFRSAAILMLASLGYMVTPARAAEPPPMSGDTVLLESIDVGPTYEIAKISNLVEAQTKYDALSQSIRDVIDLRFYLVERQSRKIVVGTILKKIRLELVSSDGEDRLLPVAENGQVEIPLAGEKRFRGRLMANVPKNRFDLGFRLSIKIPPNQPLTLGFLRAAADKFLEAYKPYAGLTFRAFIGDRKPNCFGMNFFDPQSVQVISPGSTTPIWRSQPGTRVTVFFSDLPTSDPSAVISWTGDVAPYFTAACLMSHEASR